MPRAKRPLRLFFLSLLNGLLMLCLSLYWQGLPYTFGDEAFLIKWTALTKKSLLGLDAKPPPESVLLVDISGNKTTLPETDVNGKESDYQRVVITDRSQLAEFLAMLEPYREDTRTILLDVLFDKPTPDDTLLQQRVDVLQDKLLSVTRIDTSTRVDTSYIQFDHQAIATYRSAGDLFLKYPLIMGDSLPTAPLLLYERLHGKKLDPSGWFYRFPDGISLRNPIVDFKVRDSDFRSGSNLRESNFHVWSLGDLLEARTYMPEEDLARFFENRIVLVGDFKTDVHATPFGSSAGILLIYNAYLTLVEGSNLVSIWWLLLLLAGFTLISWRILNDIEFEPPRWLRGLFRSKLARWLLEAVDEAVLLIGLTVLSYFLFNVHVNILVLLVYCKVFDVLWNRFRPSLLSLGKRKEKRSLPPKLPQT